ncbi:pilus assembly protein TadG-related protein [Geomonas ferrireducens]|uniref:pilus assembly protein TadG-related protein n=1 Tax=Geomonas ferrireducens TaxID=2570227 RepID=UPI0010A8722F|nr:pilus assembly protein TadG-related protein [Geomonas ferrireducens]
MDANRRIRKSDHRGFAVVYLALMIVVLVGFVSLAVDLGYMYVTRGQLQNAADAAALAGAAMNLGDSASVKQKAIEFAAKNKAAGDDVAVTEGDVTIGNWTATATPSFSTARFPINAVRVVARRTVAGASAAEQGKVQLFFGKIFALLPGGGEGWPEMSASAEAIAMRPPRPTIPIALCLTPCSMPTPPSVAAPVKFFFKQSGATAPPPELTVGWTDFSFTSAATDLGPQSDIAKYIHGEMHPADVCNKGIYTNNGVGEAVKELQDEFNSQKDADGKWEVIVPILSPGVDKYGAPVPSCPPGDQPIPYPLNTFAIAWIVDVDRGATPGVTFSRLDCLPCGDPSLMGKSPVLVK